jgi:hypothetical protein
MRRLARLRRLLRPIDRGIDWFAESVCERGHQWLRRTLLDRRTRRELTDGAV